MHRAALATATAVLGVLAAPSSASAAPTQAAPLVCEGKTHLVTGFGRGQVLHVVGSTVEYVVARAATASGVVVFDSPGLAGDAALVSCTATSPDSGRSFAFEGFFTPRG